MDSIIADVQDQIVDHIRNGVTDSDGNQRMRVEMTYTDNEFELADYVADNERRVGRIPHAFVFAGTTRFEGQDSSFRLQSMTIPVRIFVATRNNSQKDQQVQHRLASKWCMYVSASIIGQPIETITGSTGYLEELNVEYLVNTERSAMWEVRAELPVNLDADLILQEIDNE